jgi:hypothetical protein
MGRKQLRKVHVEGKEYVYTVRKGFEGTGVNIYESGNKGSVFHYVDFDEYTQIKPSMVKEAIEEKLKENANWDSFDFSKSK